MYFQIKRLSKGSRHMTKVLVLPQLYIIITLTRKKKGYHSLLVVLKHHMLYKPNKTLVEGLATSQGVPSPAA